MHALKAESSNHVKEKQVLELSLKVKEDELTVKEECAASMEKELQYLRAKCKELEVEGNKLDKCVKEFKYVVCLLWNTLIIAPTVHVVLYVCMGHLANAFSSSFIILYQHTPEFSFISCVVNVDMHRCHLTLMLHSHHRNINYFPALIVNQQSSSGNENIDYHCIVYYSVNSLYIYHVNIANFMTL